MEPFTNQSFNEILVKYIDYFFSISTSMGLVQLARSPFGDALIRGERVDWRTPVLFFVACFFMVSDWFFFHTIHQNEPL